MNVRACNIGSGSIGLAGRILAAVGLVLAMTGSAGSVEPTARKSSGMSAETASLRAGLGMARVGMSAQAAVAKTPLERFA